MMNRATRWAWSALAFAAVFPLIALGVEACGSDSFTGAPSTDGGDQDGSTVSDASPAEAGDPFADACVKPPTVSLEEQPFCNAYAEITTRCLDCKQCWQDNANACQAFGSSISVALRNGIIACKDSIQCDDFSTQTGLLTEPCIAAWLTDAGVTAAQVAANQAYCSNCADAGTAVDYCTNYFSLPDGGGSVGSLTLIVSDSVATDIAKSCKTCDALTYPFACSIPTFCKAAGKDTCGDGLCKP